ncbi:reverse transcriptase [Plakobranchus ocellatus]|uniref:Reverse transcriptase n=1 Tax=Plakobranchus ocellatus TaxID=259542 RepID=A0AAV3YST7_9GAST|nr:reverse transcriptase [Plakobranchus ocellatus]
MESREKIQQVEQLGYRVENRFRRCKPEEAESADMFIVRIKAYLKTYLNRWMESSNTKQTYKKLRDFFVQEQFMNANTELTVVFIRGKVRCDLLEIVGKEADL